MDREVLPDQAVIALQRLQSHQRLERDLLAGLEQLKAGQVVSMTDDEFDHFVDEAIEEAAT